MFLPLLFISIIRGLYSCRAGPCRVIHCNAARATRRRHTDAPLSAYYMELVTSVATARGGGRQEISAERWQKLKRCKHINSRLKKWISLMHLRHRSFVYVVSLQSIHLVLDSSPAQSTYSTWNTMGKWSQTSCMRSTNSLSFNYISVVNRLRCKCPAKITHVHELAHTRCHQSEALLNFYCSSAKKKKMCKIKNKHRIWVFTNRILYWLITNSDAWRRGIYSVLYLKSFASYNL